MLHHIYGDLLKSDCSVILHQSNCFGGYGSGIAGQIRYKLPGAYRCFFEDDRTPQDKLGSYSLAFDDIRPFRYVVNVYGQFDFGGQPGVVYTKYDALKSGVESFMEFLDKKHPNEIFKIGVPYKMGAGLAGGEWEIIFDILRKISEKYKRDIYTYEFTP